MKLRFYRLGFRPAAPC